jgi:hypothetical protein
MAPLFHEGTGQQPATGTNALRTREGHCLEAKAGLKGITENVDPIIGQRIGSKCPILHAS